MGQDGSGSQQEEEAAELHDSGLPEGMRGREGGSALFCYSPGSKCRQKAAA